MPAICYKEKRFHNDTLDVIATANTIIREYAAQGFSLTLRQLYYQFVARAIIPNTEKSYKRLGSIVNDARMAGLIDWNTIEDRTRWLRELPHWGSPADIVAACAQQFRYDMWADQKYRPEVWIEKDALIGVVEGICEKLDVPHFACRGYVSQSEQWRAGQRHEGHLDNGQQPIVFHLGDHDPSGMDMTRDNRSRLRMFAEAPRLEVRRLALNMDQVNEHSPPPNPTKLTDSRAGEYIDEYGMSCWELDALEPAVIVDLIRTNVEALIDRSAWDQTRERQAIARGRIEEVADELRQEND